MSGIREHTANLLIKAKSRPEGYSRIVRRGEMGLKHLEFGLLRLSSGDWSGKTGKCEQALDIYSGVISLDAPDFSCERLGGRKSVFEGPPTVIYLPPGVSYRVSVLEGPVEIGIFSATARTSKASRSSSARATSPSSRSAGTTGAETCGVSSKRTRPFRS